MKKIILILLLFTGIVKGQGTANGSGYQTTHTIDCPTVPNAQIIRFGNGTVGRVELCLTINSLVNSCGGGNNKSDQVFIYEDRDNDGSPETPIAVWVSSTAVNSCVLSTMSNGYIWLRFCGDGGCDAGDMTTSKVTVSWTTYISPTNNLLGGSLAVNQCGTSFTANNIAATATENCDGYVGNTGPPDNLTVAFENNLDCNNGTTIGGVSGANGGDVAYSVENDIWYKFCPGSLGTWTISLTKNKCYAPTGPTPTSVYGYQYALFQGTSTNLGNVISGGTAGQNNTGTTTISVNVTSTTNCYYMQIDGYGGTGCIFGFTLTAPVGACVILPIKLIRFSGRQVHEYNYIEWSTSSEIGNDYFILEKSQDGITFENLKSVDGSVLSISKIDYLLVDTTPYDITYYRLKQIDNNGNFEYSNIISVHNKNTDVKVIKITNILGQEVTEDSEGINIYYYSNGVIEKKYKNK